MRTRRILKNETVSFKNVTANVVVKANMVYTEVFQAEQIFERMCCFLSLCSAIMTLKFSLYMTVIVMLRYKQ